MMYPPGEDMWTMRDRQGEHYNPDVLFGKPQGNRKLMVRQPLSVQADAEWRPLEDPRQGILIYENINDAVERIEIIEQDPGCDCVFAVEPTDEPATIRPDHNRINGADDDPVVIRVKVIALSDDQAACQYFGEVGTLAEMDFAHHCGQDKTNFDDPMIGIQFADGKTEHFWKEEIELV